MSTGSHFLPSDSITCLHQSFHQPDTHTQTHTLSQLLENQMFQGCLLSKVVGSVEKFTTSTKGDRSRWRERSPHLSALFCVSLQTHSLTHRRAVPGRRKNFDLLLAEHKGRAKEKEGVKEKDKEGGTGGKDGCSQSTSVQESPSKPHCPNGRPLSTLRLRLANAHIPR